VLQIVHSANFDWGRDMENYVLGTRDILVLRQQDNLPIRLMREYVLGPLGSVHWECLETTAMQIIRAVSSALELPEEALVMEEFSGLAVPSSPVGLLISAAPGKVGDLALEQVELIRAVAQSYLKQLKNGESAAQGEFDFTAVVGAESPVRRSLQERVHADLAMLGGKPIRTPMVLESGAAKLLLAGAYAAKPVVPRKPPERFELVGRVVGVNSHHKRATAFTTGNDEIELECDPNRFAHQIRDAIHTPRRFVFGVLRNFDGKGREQLVLTDVAEIDAPLPDPDSLI